jgi:zinc transporter ZupT
MAQPFGAALGWLFLAMVHLETIPAFFYGAMYSATAGIMVCVSLMELLPEALQMASPRFVMCWAFIGFCAMECSIMLLNSAS